MQHPHRDDADSRIQTALNGLTVILGRAQLMRRRLVRMQHPFADTSLHDLALIEASCRAIAEDMQRLHESEAFSFDLLDRHERHLAELRRLLEAEVPDLAAIRRLAS